MLSKSSEKNRLAYSVTHVNTLYHTSTVLGPVSRVTSVDRKFVSYLNTKNTHKHKGLTAIFEVTHGRMRGDLLLRASYVAARGGMWAAYPVARASVSQTFLVQFQRCENLSSKIENLFNCLNIVMVENSLASFDFFLIKVFI
jgi:hypothetical protein